MKPKLNLSSISPSSKFIKKLLGDDILSADVEEDTFESDSEPQGAPAFKIET